MSEELAPDPIPAPTSVARELLRCCPYGREAQRDAEDAIRRDELKVYALYASYKHDQGIWHTQAGSKAIDDKLWRRIVAEKRLDAFWKRSQVLLEWDGTGTGWDLRGIRIEPTSLIEFLSRYALTVTVDPTGQLRVPGQARRWKPRASRQRSRRSDGDSTRCRRNPARGCRHGAISLPRAPFRAVARPAMLHAAECHHDIAGRGRRAVGHDRRIGSAPRVTDGRCDQMPRSLRNQARLASTMSRIDNGPKLSAMIASERLRNCVPVT